MEGNQKSNKVQRAKSNLTRRTISLTTPKVEKVAIDAVDSSLQGLFEEMGDERLHNDQFEEDLCEQLDRQTVDGAIERTGADFLF